MLENKRGLSGVVTTLLLVLLGIAAVVVIWVVVQGLVDDTGSQAELSGQCLELQLEIDSEASSCEADIDEDVNECDVTVSRGGGTSDEIGGVIVAVENSDGERETNRTSGNLEPLGSTAITVPGIVGEDDSGETYTVEATPYLIAESGEDYVCSSQTTGTVEVD